MSEVSGIANDLRTLAGPTVLSSYPDIHTVAADLLEAQEATIEAVKRLLAHWDERDGPEKLGEFEGVEYWSPAGRMVDTGFIHDLRLTLSKAPSIK